MNIEELIKVNEGLIYKIALKYREYYNIEDLYQVGCIGIIKAYKNFNQNASAKFSSYAYKYIFGEIIEYIKCDRNIRVNEEYIAVYKRYEEVKQLLTHKYGREPKFSEICIFMEISESDMLHIIETISFTKSIDSEVQEYSVDDRDKIDEKILLDTMLESLNSFDKSLIDYRYYQDYTQSETATALGVTQVKVSREEKIILQRIKKSIA